MCSYRTSHSGDGLRNRRRGPPARTVSQSGRLYGGIGHRRAGMPDDRGDDRLPVRLVQLVAAPIESEEGCTGDSVGEGDTMRDREDRIARAMDHEEWCAYLV